MTKNMSFAYLFGLIFFGIGLISFIFKLIIIVNEFSDYESTLRIFKELTPGFVMVVIGIILIVIVQTGKAEQSTKDQIRKIVKYEKTSKKY